MVRSQHHKQMIKCMGFPTVRDPFRDISLEWLTTISMHVGSGDIKSDIGSDQNPGLEPASDPVDTSDISHVIGQVNPSRASV